MEQLFMSSFIAGIITCPIIIKYGTEILMWFYKNSVERRDTYLMPSIYVFNGILCAICTCVIYTLLGKYYGH